MKRRSFLGAALATAVAGAAAGQEFLVGGRPLMIGGGTQLSFPRSPFPLSIHSSGRYFVQANGSPFFFFGDTAWSAAVQLTSAQMDTYLNDRQSRGFTGIIVNLIEHEFSSQTPAYVNANGDAPFTSMSTDGNTVDFSTTNNAYWNQVDYLLTGARDRGMLVVAFPAYLGYNTSQGWQDAVYADTAAHLQTYGAFLANRYGAYGNIIWGMSGDTSPTASQLSQQWNIVTGMRSVRTDQLIYVKANGPSSGYELLTTSGYGLANYPGFNVNNVYAEDSGTTYGEEPSLCATNYAVSPAMPFFIDEDWYDGGHTTTPSDIRFEAFASFLSGACGYFFGNNPVWTYGCANNTFYTGSVSGINPGPYPGAPATILVSEFLDTTATQHAQVALGFFRSIAWQKLVPKTDTSLVTTALGTYEDTVCPALASDASFAVIYTGLTATGFTVNLAALSISSIRARWFDPTNGTYTTDSGSPYTNSGTHAFTTPGNNAAGNTDWALVLDA